MPKIQFANLPRPLWEHLLQRVDERRKNGLKLGRVAPAGDWYNDFGSFILGGTGQFPKTVLEKGMKPFGNPVA